MNAPRILAGGLALACLLGVPSAHATPPPSISSTVGVCDPNAATHCIKPNADGSINTNGGGGGGGSVYGPTAVGSAAANPPVLTGGTANAGATGNVQVIKVDSSGFQHVVVETGANTIGNVGLVAGSAVIGHVINDASSAVIGHVVADSGSTTAVTQATAANLNATVVGTGTFATQSTLQAGAALVGKVGIDQTTPGTTNAVADDGVVDGQQVSGTVSSAATLVTMNTQGYGYLAFQFTSIGSGNTVLVESSSDGVAGTGTTFVTASPLRVDSGVLSGVGGSAPPVAAAIYVVPVTGATMRLRVSAYGSGTVTIAGVLKRGAVPPTPGQVVLGNVGSGGADGGSPVKVGGKVAAPITGLTAANRQDALISPSGGLYTEEDGRSFSNISTNATTTVKSGVGFLHTICINTKGATANVATIYDNTAGSGTTIGTLDTTGAVGCLTYDIAFATGLTIVTATGTAANLTVSYR